MTERTVQMPAPVPREYCGKWVAWTPNGLYILGAGDTPEEARRNADANGPKAGADWSPKMKVAYQWVPPANEHFIGNAVV